MKRKPMNKNASKRYFKNTSKPHPKNMPNNNINMRGGIKL